MPEPSLNEITNMTVDSERGTGTPAVIYDNREVGRLLNDNAQFKARNDWNRYNVFLGNLKDVYKDLNEIAKQPVMEEDMPTLRNNMAEIIKTIGDDPKGFFGGGQKYNEINGKIAELQGKAAESKGNRLFDTAHREFFYRNPDLESPENKAMIEEFRKQPLGGRKPYQLMMPGLIDFDALSKNMNEAVKKEESYSVVTPDNQFLQEGSKITYDPERFKQLAEASYAYDDKRNIPHNVTMQRRFNALPEYMKEQVVKKYEGKEDPVKEWYVDEIMKRMGVDAETKKGLRPNPGYLEKEKLAQKTADDKADLAVKWYNAKTSRINATKPTAGQKNAGIEEPAILFGEHINRVKEAIGKRDGKPLVVTFNGTDEKTRKAIDLQEGQQVTYRNDGSFVVEQKNESGQWEPKKVGTLEDLKQGYINAVKSGMNDDGTQTKEFQMESENGFNDIFGSNQGKFIWDNWKGASGKSVGSYDIKGKSYTEQELLDMGYTIDQIKPYKK